MAEILFYLFSTVSIGAVLAMILSRNPAYAALWLVLAFSSLGGLFGLLGAPFTAVVQIIVYAGAIMVLFLFVLMTIDVRAGLPREKRRLARAAAVGLALLLLAEIGLAARSLIVSPEAANAAAVKPAAIGRLLFEQYLYPFEITSLLIMAALVGAVVLVKKKDPA
ncbi:MAG: NADH-quinone oxidoreductase subunit J [Candidatus Aminicenantes bacterium]|nr:NADH-quinone oxidoreductase subunit J [Candidatus Aminicenantes bacterium]